MTVQPGDRVVYQIVDVARALPATVTRVTRTRIVIRLDAGGHRSVKAAQVQPATGRERRERQ